MYSFKKFLEVVLWVATKTRSTMDELHFTANLAVVDPNTGGEDSLIIEKVLQVQTMMALGPVNKLDVMAFITLLNQYPLTYATYMTYLNLYPDHPDIDVLPKRLPTIMEFMKMQWSDLDEF